MELYIHSPTYFEWVMFNSAWDQFTINLYANTYLNVYFPTYKNVKIIMKCNAM